MVGAHKSFSKAVRARPPFSLGLGMHSLFLKAWQTHQSPFLRAMRESPHVLCENECSVPIREAFHALNEVAIGIPIDF
jgi:hypothetical protein